LWRDVLGVEHAGIHDDFFDLGGDSIKGVIFINRLQERLGEIVHVVNIFNAPTIASFARYMEEQHANAVARITGVHVPHAERSGSATVTGVKLAQIKKLIAPLPPRVEERTALKNRPAIFILAPPRSGTTLLRVLLGGHPQLFSPPELELLSFNTLAERRDAFSGAFSFWLEGALAAIMENKGCGAEEAANIMRALEESDLSTKEFYGLLQEWIGDRILVDKTASYALHTGIMKRAEFDFENALYIHLLRHPRGMIHSFEEAKLDQIFFRYAHTFTRRELAEMIWTISHQNILEFLQDVPMDRQHQLKFEDLVSRPRESLEQVCRFLGVELHADMLQPYKDGAQRMTDGIHAESRMLGDVKFHSYKNIEASVAERWKEQADRNNLADETKTVAALLGYEIVEERKTEHPDSEQLLVPIQPRGSLPSFFCAHAVGGNVFSYVGLARRLGPTQPFYAIQARGLMGTQEPHTRIEEMAADYIQAIRVAQHTGPYLLGGWSMGGLVAFEMACQLLRQGQQVALVALFDSITPYTARFRRENEQAMQVANFAFHIGLSPAEFANVSEQLLSLDEETQLQHLFKLAQRTRLFPKGFNLTQLHHLFKVFRSNNEAALAYQPRPCSAPLVLFRAAETMDEELTDTSYGWSHLAEGPLEIEVVTGNHFTMLDEPHVSLLAEKLRLHIARATSSTDYADSINQSV
jgi:thioesterase domain-containing protein